jgi:hypothetical protein
LFAAALTVALLAIPASGSVASAAKAMCNGVPATIVGTPKNDLIRGTAGRDVIVARAGADNIRGRGGNDLICAGRGNDVVKGGDGRDVIFGYYGRDKLKGGNGFDILDGGPKPDACYVGAQGGKTRNCEEADLVVTVKAPATVSPKTPFSIVVVVRNKGSKPALGVDLKLDYRAQNTTCDLVDPSGVQRIKPLAPGHWSSLIFSPSCDAEKNGRRLVTMAASATTASPELVKGNNSGVSRTEIIL